MDPLRDRYGRTITEVQEAERRGGFHLYMLGGHVGDELRGCTDPECPDWQVSDDGIFWQHSHVIHEAT